MHISHDLIDYTERVFSAEELRVISEMADSIKTDGLWHSIIIEPVADRYSLVVGLKRLIANKRAGNDSIECHVLAEGTSEAERKEMRLKENLIRLNLPWYEEVVLHKELHEMRQLQHGKGKQGKKTGWSLRDTAEEIGIGFGTLSEDLRLAEAVMADPNMRKITDKVTAKRLIFNTAKRMDAEAEASAPTQIDFNTTYLGDSSEILKHFPNNTFDVCFTDPPWIDFKEEKLRKDLQTVPVFKELYRVMKNDSFLYMIVSTPDFIFYQQELPKFGFKVQQMPLIWVKQNVISHGTRSWEYGRDYEPILLAVKGSPVLAVKSQLSCVYTSAAVHPSKAIHPNEKPVDVPMYFLEHCSYEGSMVIDPFGGSGVTAEACIRTGRRYVVIERDKEFFDNINKRLQNVHSANEQGA